MTRSQRVTKNTVTKVIVVDVVLMVVDVVS